MIKIKNGKAVICTDKGVEIVPAEIRRNFNVQGEMLIIRPSIGKGTRYIFVGGANTKFFGLILDLMKLAQFDPLAGFNGTECCFLGHYFSTLKNPRESIESDINFVERRYSYNDG